MTALAPLDVLVKSLELGFGIVFQIAKGDEIDRDIVLLHAFGELDEGFFIVEEW